MSLSMVKQEVESDMSVKVFVQKKNCAKKTQNLVSFSLPEWPDRRLENVT